MNSDKTLDHLDFFKAAARVAQKATCRRAKCGSVIVKDGKILAEGFNAPPLNDEANRTCDETWNNSKKPKYDTTCCIHAEWNAILSGLTEHGEELQGSTLYFMRIDDKGSFTDAGEPYCTVCSRLSLQAGVASFALWDSGKTKLYPTKDYNSRSYSFHAKS